MKKLPRRTFLKAAAVGGAALSMPTMFRRVHAQSSSYDGPYWIFVGASGGWDPIFMFDPTLDTELNRVYTSIGTSGNISYAPIPLDYDLLDYDPMAGYEPHLLTPEMFLDKHRNALAVINGIDTQTNNHDAGRRAMGSGQLTAGYPALAALVAGVKAPTLPMAMFSGGGYDLTQNLVPLTRVGDANALTKLARPNEVNAGDVDTPHYHTPATMARIVEAQRARGQAQLDAQHLPVLRQSMQELLQSRIANSDIERLELPDGLVELPGGLGALQGFERQAQLAISAFKSGLAVSATLQLGGFDTHGNHDRDHSRRVLDLLSGIDFIIEEAARQGLGDNVIIVATSDFGRGPFYNGENDGSGKDHWPITSAFALGPGISGNRVVGATNAGRLARNVNPDTLELDNNGVTIGPEHVHRALRRVGGILNHEMSQRFPLPGDDLALFG
jgi:uncharacterized protein (DUF1501 family)